MIGIILVGVACGMAVWDLFYSKPKGVSVKDENPDSKAIQALKFFGVFFGTVIIIMAVMLVLTLIMGNYMICFLAVVMAWAILRLVRNKKGGKWDGK